jgi:transposase
LEDAFCTSTENALDMLSCLGQKRHVRKTRIDDDAPTLSTTAVAAALEVSERTVRSWIESGRIKPDLWTLGGHVRNGRARFRPSTVAKLRAEQQQQRRKRPRAA